MAFKLFRFDTTTPFSDKDQLPFLDIFCHICFYLDSVRAARGYKFELELTSEEKARLLSWLGACRVLWNLALEQREINWSRRKQTSFGEQSKELASLKEAYPFFADVPHHCLQQKLKDLDAAFSRFFSGIGDYPNRKKKGRSVDSIRFPDPKQFDLKQTSKVSYRKKDGKEWVKGFGRIDLPKIGVLKFRQSRLIRGEVKNITISGGANDKFFVSFCVEENCKLPVAPARSIGIDRGVHQMGMTSEAEQLEIPKQKLIAIEQKLSRLQRRMSKKKKFSKNWIKTKKQVSKMHSRLANIRHDTIHKITTQLAQNHSFIAIEDLKIKNMTASASGTLEEPGTNVASKSGLNRSILRQGWGLFSQQLEYKLRWREGLLVKVPPAYTSQTCNSCGRCEPSNREGIAFKCLACGHEDHADVNAARNILKVGLDVAQSSASAGKPVEKKSKTLRRIRNPKARKSLSPTPAQAG